jgi:transcriptional regulator with XRE-family HTH domain
MKITDPTSLLIAARIRRYRTETLGWSLAEVSTRLPEESNLSGPLIGRIENGVRSATVAEIADLCAALGCAFDWLTRAGELCTTCGQEITR